MTTPRTSIGPFSSPGATPRPWAETEWALRHVQNFHLCTVRRDGRPHVTPLVAVWAFAAACSRPGRTSRRPSTCAPTRTAR
ncbi:hypothetical protein [Pseudonocardia sp. ICBG601]|uniref:hypothetical protein n=1 Tax=Pseudonocardia sp. ICBG601 TaxID=2846759 RepID=UPI001CF6581A|nr:hypothetical protein [Pseudonocardia sp. ICBG601]